MVSAVIASIERDAIALRGERGVMDMDRAKRITVFLLRVVAGLLFLQAGGMKLFDWFGGVPAQFGGHPPLMSQIGIAVLLCFIFLFFAAHGAGDWSLDARLRRKGDR